MDSTQQPSSFLISQLYITVTTAPLMTKCPLPNVGSAGESDAPPPRDTASDLMDDGFDLATQLPLFNPTAVDNSNDSVTGGECPFPTK
jgi:hypothetical protein